MKSDKDRIAELEAQVKELGGGARQYTLGGLTILSYTCIDFNSLSLP